MVEIHFDGLVGPTHNYGGLARGNLASVEHGGRPSNPRAAALEGLAKMRFVRGLGALQGLLPPPARPSLPTLRALGFHGSDEAVLTRAAREAPLLLRLCASASAMWTANAATVAPHEDSDDGLTHLVPANLATMFHRSIEAPFTERLLRTVFSDGRRFAVHAPLPASGSFADEGAANHSRLCTTRGVVHLFGWGRRAFGPNLVSPTFPARQTQEASAAVARLLGVQDKALLWQQHPAGIDAGAFHTDVLAVGSQHVLLLHERAFLDAEGLIAALRQRLGDELVVVLAREDELSAREAARAYPFNSQLIELRDGSFAIVAPRESEASDPARRFLERVLAEADPVQALHYLDVRQSMDNGGGPACLRLRVRLDDAEQAALTGRVLVDDALLDQLEGWVKRHYRDRLTPDDLGDPLLWREVQAALDELSRLLGLEGLYDLG